MDNTKDIKQLLREIVEDKTAEIYSLVCKVDAVDESARTVDVSPINGSAKIFDVRLQADQGGALGFVGIPKVGANVVVTFINQKTGFVSVATEYSKLLIDCDEITMNGGGNNGLIIIAELTTKLNQLVSQLSSELDLIASGITSAGGAYTPGALSQFSRSDFEDTKIKH